MRRTACLLAIVLLAGCGGSAPKLGPLGDYVHTDIDGVELMTRAAHEKWFDAYGMQSNPGHPDPARFQDPSGASPEEAAGAIYHSGESDRETLFVFAYRFADSETADSYLDFVCPPSATKAFLRDGRIIVQVAWGQDDPVLNAAAAQAVAHAEDAGATDAC